MAETTGIAWCDSTFNPWIGCTRVSPACDHCYAARSTPARTLGVVWGAGQPRRLTAGSNWKLPRAWQRQVQAFQSLHGRRRRVFCASLADWLDNEVAILWLVELLELIRSTPDLDWLLLSKRIGNWAPRISEAIGFLDEQAPAAYPLPLRAWLAHWLDGDEAPHNVWLGATVIDQAEVDRDAHKLLRVPASVRFLSIEPMLGPIDIRRHLLSTYDKAAHDRQMRVGLPTDDKVHWVIVGGESGPHARAPHPEWVRDLRDQCDEWGTPFFFKQWGGKTPGAGGCDLDGAERKAWPLTATRSSAACPRIAPSNHAAGGTSVAATVRPCGRRG